MFSFSFLFFTFSWINKGQFWFSHLLMYFLCRFTNIFLKSNLNHEIAILSDICTNIFKLMA